MKTKKIIITILFSVNIMAVGFSAETSNQANLQNDDTKIIFVQNLQAILETEDIKNAIAFFDTLSEKDSEDIDLMIIKSSLLISSGNLEEASKLLSSLEKKEPSNLEILEMKIVAAKAGGTKTLAEKKSAISKVISLDPNNATANIELAQEQVLNRKYKTARNYYRKALTKEPNNLEALFGLGQTSYYMNELSESKKAFNKMLEINPSEAIAYQYLAKLEAENSNYKSALEFINKAISLNDNKYEFYIDLGVYSRFLGKFDDAEKAWTKAISINPDYFLAYTYRAGLYDETNRFDKALDDYRKIVEKNPKYYFAYESLGILAWHANNFDEARIAFEKAYNYNSENISYPLMIAACYIKSGKLQNAKTFLANVMKKMSDKTSVEFSMIRLYHDQGPGNAENDLAVKIPKIDKMTPKGKMLFYFALYYDMKGIKNLAQKYYTEVKNMQNPMFFEYRLAEWSLEK